MDRRTLITAALALPVLTACGRGTGGQPAGGAAGLVLGDAVEPETLHPLATMYGFHQKICEGLYAVTADGGITPLLADGTPTVDSTGARWRVRVAAGHRFSSGAEVTPQDVAATYRAILDPRVGSQLADYFTMLRQVDVDGDEVVFVLAEPYAGLDRLLTVGVPPAAMVDGPVDRSSLARQPVGSGPYQLVSWTSGQSLVLEPNPHYRSRPQVERVTVAFATDQNVLMQRASAGELDGAQVAPVLAQTFSGRRGWTVWASPSADFRAITFPRNHPALRDRRVRRALNMAVDRQQMVDGILRGYGAAASTPFTPAQGDLYEPSAVFAHDPAVAGRLLDEAGWVMDADGTRARDGRRFTLTVMYFPDDLLRRDLAVAFAADMKKIGVDVAVDAVGRAQFGPRVPDDAALFGGGDMPYHPDQHVSSLLDGQWAAFDPKAPYRNPSGYRNEAVDALLARGRRTDGAERAQAYRQIQSQWMDDPAMVVLVALQHTYIARGLDGWQGYSAAVEPHEHGAAWGPWWNLDQWTRR